MFHSGTACRQQRRLKRKEVYGKPLHFVFNVTVNLKLIFFFKKKQRQKSQNIIVYTYTHISMCIYLIMNHMKPAVVE